MDRQYLQQLEKDAAAGKRMAERLLIFFYLAEGKLQALTDVLDQVEGRRGQVERCFVEAELACFHGYSARDEWQNMLRDCCEADHGEAIFIASVYHDWAQRLHTNNLQNSELSWQQGWHDWVTPEWTTVANANGVRVESSTPFAPAALLTAVRSMLSPGLLKSSVVDPETGRPIAHPVRINQCVQWFPEQLGWLGKLFECRLAEAADYQVGHGEVCTLLNYRPGDQYRPHVDCISPQQAQSIEGIAQGGQRVMTVLLSMGDDDVIGGETNFPDIDCQVRLRNGELLRFNNVDEQGQPLRSSLHEGMVVHAGEKWLMSKWVREQRTPYGKELQLI